MQPLVFYGSFIPYSNVLKMSHSNNVFISDYFHYDIFTSVLLTKNQENGLKGINTTAKHAIERKDFQRPHGATQLMLHFFPTLIHICLKS